MRWLIMAAVALVASWGAATVSDARFAASNGEFAGRDGDTCVLCHARATAVPAAILRLEGLPTRWDASETYSLRVTVAGGPPASPDPRPQGGFELEASGGHLTPGEGMEDYLRIPQASVVTYTPLGTQMRSWTLEWTAPGLETPPGAITFWLAGVAANGNHFMSGDDGESGDAAASLSRTLRPSERALITWRSLPLMPPVIDEVRPKDDGWQVLGHHTDANATHLAYRIGDGPWMTTRTSHSWTLVTAQDPTAVQLRSEGHGRTSAPAADTVDVEAPAPSVPNAFLALTLLAMFCRKGALQ